MEDRLKYRQNQKTFEVIFLPFTVPSRMKCIYFKLKTMHPQYMGQFYLRCDKFQVFIELWFLQIGDTGQWVDITL